VIVDDGEPDDIFQLIASQNGPLIDYHPIVLVQCILWSESASDFNEHQSDLGKLTERQDRRGQGHLDISVEESYAMRARGTEEAQISASGPV
jgi:hypothetical protein